ncbi:alpha/beta fold hydrolase [Novosphingobium sp.]|uniref:alpha/beta hydrolase family protein n=1 Tax=Novosphingobium sp. TaxID=1874826 RepID=UPI00286EB073|nr:alpha/beta fold hydrolase [Novosphingobium sp.]
MSLLRRFLTLFALILALPQAALAAPDGAGTWHGAGATPIGELMLVVRIERVADGTLKGDIESRNQNPGRTMPLTSVALDKERLTFAVESLQAKYEGTWSEAEKAWVGTFTQGIEMKLALKAGDAPATAVIAGLDGRWGGEVVLNGVTLRQGLRFRTAPTGTIGLYESPDQMVSGVPVRGLARDGNAVRFTIMNGMLVFSGTLADDGQSLAGTLAQPGQTELAITLKRQAATAKAAAKRPQLPVAPFPYRSEEVSIPNPAAPGVTLAGTLTLPQGKGPFPAAILISGSGPQDRDETLAGHKPFAVIADHLTRHGFAVLRHDDRGTDKSTGDFSKATSADFASDANAAFAWLAARPEIASGKIGFIGHSEGGMIAPIAMAGNPKVAYAVLLAGPGTRLDQLMLSQQRLVGSQMGRSEADLDKAEPVFAQIFAAVAKSKDNAETEAAIAAIFTPQARADFGLPADAPASILTARLGGPWFRYFLNYDPVPNLARIKVPVLAINGSLDRQVPAADNLAAIRKALAANKDVTIVELPGLNHLFQTAKTGGIGEYQQIEETFAPAALDLMTTWLQKRFAGP